MRHVSSVLFAISASLDALLTGLLLGLKKIRIPIHHNLCISGITLLGTFCAIWLGNSLSPYFSTPFLSVLGDSAGSIILSGMGLYYLGKALSARRRKKLCRSCCDNPPDSIPGLSPPDKTTAGPTNLPRRKLLLLSLALSVNNMGIGVGAGLAGLPLISSCFFILLFSLLFLSAGNRLSRTAFSGLPDILSDLLCGLLLIVLGIVQLL